MSATTETFYDPQQKIWSGPKRADIYGPQVTLGSAILNALTVNPSKIVQISDSNGAEMTAAKLLSDSQLIAAEFLNLGLKPGDVIGIYAKNTCNLAAVVVASLLCGTPWNAIFPEFDETVIKQMFELTTPKIICCNVENYGTLESALKEMKSQAFVYTINGKIPKVRNIEEIVQSSGEIFTERSFPGLNLDGDATAIILCSSGTTGPSKGVLVSHRSLLNNNIYREVNADSVLFCYSTLFWISGVWTLLTSLLNGARHIITDLPSTPENFLNLVEKYGVTHALPSTSLVTQIVQESKTDREARLNSVHCLCYGGTKIHSTMSENLYKLFNYNAEKLAPLICYGMTEVGGIVSETYTKNTVERRYDTEGKLMPNMEVCIADRETGALLGPNEAGFVLVRSPYKWSGYYRNLKATKEIYEHGWINIRDVGYFDDEGYLFITGRESDLFRSNSFQVYPNSLEDVIIQIPGVAEVCVFGVPDLVVTNLIACAVVRMQNAEGAALTSEHVLAYVKQHIDKAFHLTGGVYFLVELPKTPSGKLLRRKVYDVIKAENA